MLSEAIRVANMNGWQVQHIGQGYVTVVYDDGGSIARAFDRNRGRGLARATIMEKNRDGSLSTKLLSKWTTNLLHWIRYAQLKKAVNECNSRL